MRNLRGIDILETLAEARTEYVNATLAALPLIKDKGERLATIQALAGLVYGRDRNMLMEVTPLGTDSLVGSYFRGRDDEDEEVEGMVVGQPFVSSSTTIYLCEFFGESGALGYQQLVDIDRMLVQKWTFFDSDSWLARKAEAQESATAGS